MENSPFTAVGDEPVEARIVAWVLGEASAFEAAELERLCDERPELLVFRRRMRALHGLLTEAEAAQPDEGWKLPPEKRQALDGIFGAEKPVTADLVIERRIRHSGRRAFLAIAACLILTFIVAGLMAPMVVRQRKKADMSVSREAERSIILATDLPPELIEGTPKPMNVPNLEQPVNGPAGWSSRADARDQLANYDVHGRSSLSERKPSAPAASRPALPAPASAAVKPDAPVSSTAKAIAANWGGAPESREARPRIVPPMHKLAEEQKELAANEKAVRTEGDEGRLSPKFGLDRSAGASPPPPPAQPAEQQQLAKALDPKSVTATSGATSGLRSGDQAVAKANIDAVLSDPANVSDEKNSPDDGKKEAAGKDPVVGDIPVLGRLFDRDVAEAEKPAPALPETAARDAREPEAETTALSDPIRSNPAMTTAARFENLPPTRGMIVDKREELAGGSEELLKAIKDQEDKVEERRKVLATIVRTKGIIYKGTDSFYGQSGVDEDQGAKNALQSFHQLEQEKAQLESQVASMKKYENDQLMTYASGLALPDNIVKNLYPQYLESKRELQKLKINGFGDDHPTVKATFDQTEAMKRQIDEGVVSLRTTLAAQLELAESRLKSVQVMKDSTREEAIKRGIDAQDYVDAKTEFEKDQALLQQMKLKLLSAAAKAEPEKPKPNLAELMEEIVATEDPYSTFSLNISDASFKIARAALAKGERPDPAGIKVEQFYNAVDYGDPAPTAGEPVAHAIEQCAHPVIPGRNLVRVALKTAAAGRAASQPLRLTLLVDQSGSMVREDRRAAMDKALAGLAGLLTKNDLVTVIGFSRTPHLLADGWTGEQAGKLAELVNQSASEGGTNLEEAIKLGEQLAERRKLAGAQNRIVLFTDGAANLGNADPMRLAEKVKALRQKGIAFDIAGIAADGLNDELLGELARNGNGRYYVVGKGADENLAKQLAGAFRPAAENVKVQVRFNPERVGRYKLIGFEKDRLKTEDFRNDAVDAAELAADEAGVAVYQVEPLPGGSGELGEVSVRFRDTTRGEMVERTWTIPHDTNTPAFDRATPPMQLAVLAMLAAEKLRGGPLAEAIDFKQLAAPRANVKQFYGHNGRVAEVLHMIDSL